MNYIIIIIIIILLLLLLLCAVHALLAYLATWGDGPGPLFLCQNGQPLSRTLLSNWLRQIMASAGISGNFSSHSFRIGTATIAGHNCIPDHLIQELGWWKSNAFQSYIRTPSASLSQKLAWLAFACQGDRSSSSPASVSFSIGLLPSLPGRLLFVWFSPNGIKLSVIGLSGAWSLLGRFRGSMLPDHLETPVSKPLRRWVVLDCRVATETSLQCLNYLRSFPANF